jgi:hypothetical protein
VAGNHLLSPRGIFSRLSASPTTSFVENFVFRAGNRRCGQKLDSTIIILITSPITSPEASHTTGIDLDGRSMKPWSK